jgi:hypothetical protein
MGNLPSLYHFIIRGTNFDLLVYCSSLGEAKEAFIGDN